MPGSPFYVLAYNLLNFDGSDAARNDAFRHVINATRPALVLAGEVCDRSGCDAFLERVLRPLNAHFHASMIEQRANQDLAVFYDDVLFEHLDASLVRTKQSSLNRDMLCVRLRHRASKRVLRVYVAHLQAGELDENRAERAVECTAFARHIEEVVRKQAPHESVIFGGDCNIYSANEEAFKLLTSVLVDPAGDAARGDWHENRQFARLHTQSTRLRNEPGAPGGGLDDRFDLLLVSEDLKGVARELIAVGNDGKHFNKSIDFPPNARNGVTDPLLTQTLAQHLIAASDHLPVRLTLTL